MTFKFLCYYYKMKLELACILVALLVHISMATSLNPDVFNHLGVRTPYRFKSNKHDAVVEYPGCTPKKIWMMVRHGTRYPKLKIITGMETTLRDLKYEILLQHRLGKGNLSKDCLSRLEDWSVQVTSEYDDMSLTKEGEEEMTKLAERMKKRFPAIFKNKYDNKTYLFRHTATERAQESARHFSNGLFSKKDAKDVIFAPAAKVDTVLRFYKHCDKWLKQVKKNPDTYKEFRAFGASQQMNNTLETISRRLGLSKSLNLEQLTLMFVTCGFETAWTKYHLSPWCEVFDKESAEVLEYYFDLKEYWANGYGLELTYKQACLAIRNMFKHMRNNKDPKAVLFFSHSGTILKLISHLGLYKPESHLTGDKIQKDRMWKTSDIDSFAANLAFVLFDCKDADYLLSLHQEHPITLPPCGSELCSLEALTEFYHDSIHNCDFKDMCSLNKDEL